MNPDSPNINAPTASVVPPVVPQIPQKDRHGIVIATMAIFVLLALGAVAFLYYQNQQLKNMLASYHKPTPISSAMALATVDPTTNWKTYTNNTYGFSFKYPDTEAAKVTNHTGYLSTISLINSTTNNEDVVFYVASTDQTPKNNTYPSKPITIDGAIATQISLPMGQNPPQEDVYFSNNGKFFLIQFIWDGKDQNTLNTFNQILSTFKFTK